jgi:hypothetical protein
MMDTKVIEEALRDYKRKKSVIETTLERIEVFKDAINNPDKHKGLFLEPNREPGMPSAKGFRPEAPRSEVEYEILEEEEQRELLKEWIEDDQSRIYPYQIEIEQLDGAMNALTKQERYIIECKYFENMFWRDIEYSFNERFRRQNYITVEGIRKMNRQALELMTKILEPYYNRFRIKK